MFASVMDESQTIMIDFEAAMKIGIEALKVHEEASRAHQDLDCSVFEDAVEQRMRLAKKIFGKYGGVAVNPQSGE